MSHSGLKIITFIGLFIYIIINVLLSFLYQNYSFIFFGVCYLVIGSIAGSFVSKKNSSIFIRLYYLFLSIYTISAVLNYFIVYENVLFDYLSDPDETGYYTVALRLSSYSYSDIWRIAFSVFKYSEAPLFNAWISASHKISGLDIQGGALFQKLNVCFFASFIPPILYLILNKVTNFKYNSVKWAIVYGLLSYVFFYSGVLLRDIHLALLFVWASYLTLNDDTAIKNYILLCFLGLLTYFLRVENGLFFLGFFVIWLLQSNRNNKWLIAFFTLPALAVVILYLGGIENIYYRGVGTLDAYSARGVKAASEDSLGAALSRLPVPLNLLAKFGFSQIYPFPIWSIFDDNSIRNIFLIPRAVGSLFWVFVITHLMLNFGRIKIYLFKYRWLVLLSVIYIFLVSQGQPYERRLFQVYPVIYMVFVGISERKLKHSFFVFISLYTLLVIAYLALKS